MKFLAPSLAMSLALASTSASAALPTTSKVDSTRLTQEAKTWDETNCDVKKCTDWDCDEWCKCFNTYDENRGLYKKNNCDDEDGEEECNCLVNFGPEDAAHPWNSRKPSKLCPEGTFKKLNTGLPALDGTGCRPYSWDEATCNELPHYVFEPGTKNQDSKCIRTDAPTGSPTGSPTGAPTPTPLKTCYAFRHQQWRMGAHKSCRKYRGLTQKKRNQEWGNQEWTYFGQVTVKGEAVGTGCQVMNSWESTGWRSLHGRGGSHNYGSVHTGEYTPDLTMSVTYISWENDHGRRCNLDRHDDCGLHATGTMHFKASPNNNGEWQDSYYRKEWTEMHIETMTYLAPNCNDR
jgi:hypothetical protein